MTYNISWKPERNNFVNAVDYTHAEYQFKVMQLIYNRKR